MTVDTSKHHSRDDIWNRVNEQSQQISEIKAGQAATDAKLQALEATVDAGFTSLIQEIRGIKSDSRPNMLGLLAAALGLLGLFGGYSLLLNGPQNDSINRNHENIALLTASTNRANERIAALEAEIKYLTSEK